MTAIFVTHRTEGRIYSAGVAVETVATFLSGPVIYHFIRARLGLPVRLKPALLHFIPALMALAAAPALAFGRFEPPPPQLMCLYQASYTAAAAFTFFRAADVRARTVTAYWQPSALLAVMAGLHMAQLARFVIPGAAAQNAVPLFAAAGVFGFLIVALVQGRAKPTGAARYAKSSLDRVDAERLYARLLETMEREQLHRRPDLALADLAQAAGAPPHHASQALSAAGKNFSTFVSQRRVEEAKRLLVLPDNATVAVEPIGMEAGFKSRSAFYAAFKATTGKTPAEYRKENAEFVS
jgi:AraC-like DNA-binding protein